MGRRPWRTWAIPGVLLVASLGLVPTAFCHTNQPTESVFYTSFEKPDALASGAGSRQTGWSVRRVSGPSASEVLTAKPEAGFTGTHALRYEGREQAEGRAAERTLFRVRVAVAQDTHLSWKLFPVHADAPDPQPAMHVIVDLRFADGSRLSALGARDQHRVAYTARGEGASRTLYQDQWNALDIDLGAVAHGKVITDIELVAQPPAGHAAFHGYIDDIRIGPAREPHPSSPSGYVDTRRGSNANYNFSRGNTFPATAVPHGFNFWTPTTNAGSNWIYQYQESNDAQNRPHIQAFSLSHEPSPWMGDRQTFQVMPAMVAHGAPPLDRKARALAFDHDHETARPYLYRVRFDDGIVAAMTPSDHAAMMRFRFPGHHAQLVFDNVNDHGGITLDPKQRTIQGFSDVASRLSTGATRLFFYATFDRPVRASGRLTGHGRDHVAAWYGFALDDSRTVTMRIGTSLISVAQARRNLDREIPPGTDFAQVQAAARQRWDALLGRIEVPGASYRDKVTLYSNLYRLFLYPNQAFENVGTAAHPDERYASPFSPPVGKNTPTHTGARIVKGRPYVNNGFWDTYRTAWPAYALLTPHEAGQMIDGFVQQYRDGGWIARWSSPGYADLMVGTSADVAFADAWNKGVHNFDVRSFYRAALKDATVVSPIPGAGRKGLARSIFTGYTANDVDEGFSWSMAGYLNDFGLAELARNLAAHPPRNDPYAAHYADDARYFESRALGYVHLFDKAAGFFVGRKPDGDWRIDAAHFDPYAWGGDYTETNAWGMAFDAVQDGQGLANLYGGRAGLAKKLDAFFDAPTIYHVGAYGGVIHEMREAHEVRMGQYAHSNQPAHAILYMYDVAGQPWKTQDKVRDALSRLYNGSAIGQGYPGDEDNGEMSAWYVFSVAGFYPLRVGTPTYAIGAPYFPKMIIHLENGKRIVINAPNVSDKNRYIQSLTLDGKPYAKTWLRHADLADGAVLDFRMGPKPSRWGTAADEALPSITHGSARPQPLVDRLDAGHVTVTLDGDVAQAHALIDNTSQTHVELGSGDVEARFAHPQRVRMYTLTSASHAQEAPVSWQLFGSRDGRHWVRIDARERQRFAWPQQTRTFGVSDVGAYTYYRWRFARSAAGQPTSLSQIELLGRP
ncbi:GH92 family glycosyl hydrolase [Oleiagrimonas soli]|uniref:GH92 family glycosyl hydrolase n=1 Tax=Oleiagrimonas soli TaxID=1543381 RepID=UPI0009DE1366|nr:GH92 family glycosyl hydrolase [Oleiagrimonas soli]